jgi:Amt family ammonium transporter
MKMEDRKRVGRESATENFVRLPAPAKPVLRYAVFAAAACLLPLCACAAEATAAAKPPDSGHTAWMLTSTALVLFMTIPGLALFYGGLVRTRNVLSILMQCFGATALITVLWVLYGYTLAFSTEGMTRDAFNLHSLIGGLGKAFMKGVTASSYAAQSGDVPETVFCMFQLTFAIITPALIVGAFAERMKYSACMWFIGIWFTVVYLPVCHMVWSGDGSCLGSHLGVLDFAGGTVVHINAGVSALVAAVLIGKRVGYPDTPMPPHNLTMTVTGACMLWVGWFGFNAGSAVGANGSAGMAMAVTQIATAAATLAWMGIEWIRNGKPSALGAATGAVAGLVAITPASGTCGPLGALAIGALASCFCYLGATALKRKLGYDDALDAFGVHGVGGFTGALLTGVFASAACGGQIEGLDIGAQVWRQLLGSVLTIAYAAAGTFVILKVLDAAIGLRVTEAQETEGLDLSLHEERGYSL